MSSPTLTLISSKSDGAVSFHNKLILSSLPKKSSSEPSSACGSCDYSSREESGEKTNKVSISQRFSRNLLAFSLGYSWRSISDFNHPILKDDLMLLIDQFLSDGLVDQNDLNLFYTILGKCCYNDTLFQVIQNNRFLDRDLLAESIIQESKTDSEKNFLSLIKKLTQSEVESCGHEALLFREDSLCTNVTQKALNSTLPKMLQDEINSIKNPSKLIYNKSSGVDSKKLKAFCEFTRGLLTKIYEFPLDDHSKAILLARRDGMLLTQYKNYWSKGITDALFLRLIAPSLANPSLFKERGSLTIALKISKIILNLANGVQFSDESKEGKFFNNLIVEFSPRHAEYIANYCEVRV